MGDMSIKVTFHENVPPRGLYYERPASAPLCAFVICNSTDDDDLPEEDSDEDAVEEKPVRERILHQLRSNGEFANSAFGVLLVAMCNAKRCIHLRMEYFYRDSIVPDVLLAARNDGVDVKLWRGSHTVKDDDKDEWGTKYAVDGMHTKMAAIDNSLFLGSFHLSYPHLAAVASSDSLVRIVSLSDELLSYVMSPTAQYLRCELGDGLRLYRWSKDTEEGHAVAKVASDDICRLIVTAKTRLMVTVYSNVNHKPFNDAFDAITRSSTLQGKARFLLDVSKVEEKMDKGQHPWIKNSLLQFFDCKKEDAKRCTLHHHFLVIDDTLIIGSMNLTEGAFKPGCLRKNQEEVMLVIDGSIHSECKESAVNTFETLWSNSYPLRKGKKKK